MIFEAYEFYACCRVIGNPLRVIIRLTLYTCYLDNETYNIIALICIAPYLCVYNNVSSLFTPQTPSVNQRPDCILVVDSGYSFTHIVPTVMGRPVLTAIRRVNIGGKLLTNHLKEIVSFR
jgi:actin-related protein